MQVLVEVEVVLEEEESVLVAMMGEAESCTLLCRESGDSDPCNWFLDWRCSKQ